METDNSRLSISTSISIYQRRKKKGMINCLEKNVIEERTKHPFTIYFTIFACKSCVIQKSIKKKALNFLNQKVFFTIILQIFTNYRTSQRNYK